MQEIVDFDKMVGHIAGAIFTDINSKFPHPPLMLVPPLTFKVRKILEQITDLKLLSKEQKSELAKDIQIAIIPMLFSFDLDPVVIEKISPSIESAAFNALTKLT